MKKIRTPAIITGVRSKVDKSLGITLATPELSPEEKAEFMRLQGINLITFFVPAENADAPEYKVLKDIESKTPSQRLRNVLYVRWEQSGEGTDWNDYYRMRMEEFIDGEKSMLD